MSDKVETAALREKAFDIGNGLTDHLVVDLEDAEAAIEAARQQGAARLAQAVKPLMPGLDILYDRLTTDWQHHLDVKFEVGDRLSGEQVIELVEAVRARGLES